MGEKNFFKKIAEKIISPVASQHGKGNAYSSPVSHIGEAHTSVGQEDSSSSDRQSKIASREELLNAGYQPDLNDSKDRLLTNIIVLIGSCILPFIGAVYWLVKGGFYLAKTTTYFFIYREQPIYKLDNKYLAGQMKQQSATAKTYYIHPIRASTKERRSYVVKGCVALLLALVIVGFWYWVFFVR